MYGGAWINNKSKVLGHILVYSTSNSEVLRVLEAIQQRGAEELAGVESIQFPAKADKCQQGSCYPPGDQIITYDRHDAYGAG